MRPHERRSYLYFRTAMEFEGFETRKASVSTWHAVGKGLDITVVVNKRNRVRVTFAEIGTYTASSVPLVVEHLRELARLDDDQRIYAAGQRVGP